MITIQLKSRILIVTFKIILNTPETITASFFASDFVNNEATIDLSNYSDQIRLAQYEPQYEEEINDYNQLTVRKPGTYVFERINAGPLTIEVTAKTRIECSNTVLEKHKIQI